MKIDFEQLQIINDIAKEAGNAIMEIYEGDFSTSFKNDDSPLTLADIRSDQIIRDRLGQAFPGILIWSEESADDWAAGTAVRTFFLVDPLDGTKEFIKRNGEFTVNIALVHDGRPVAGVVHLPVDGVSYLGGCELGARRESDGTIASINVRKEIVGPLRIISSRSHGSTELDSWLNALEREYSFVSAGSSLKFCRVAEGAADVYPRLAPTSQWDTAAAQCILEAAGGVVVDLNGRPLTYGTDLPVLNPWFIAASCSDCTK